MRTCLLSAGDERDVIALLADEPTRNVYLLWRVAQGVLRSSSSSEKFYGMRDHSSGRLLAVLGAGANMVPGGDHEDALVELGRVAAECGEAPRMLIGRKSGTDAVWRGYSHFADPRVQLDTLHRSYEIEASMLARDLVLPRLRPATLGDLAEVEEASAQMLLDDLGRKDRDDDPALFRRRMRHTITNNEVFIYRDHDELVFKINIGARTPEVVQLQGVFTARHRRGEGIARRGAAEICRRLFAEGVHRVSLFVREDNLSARRVYEAAGFRPTETMRMIILQAEACLAG